MLTMEQILNGTIDPTEFAIDHLGLDLISSDVEVIFDIGTGDQTFAKEAINKGFKVLKTDARPQWYKVEDVIKVKVDYEDSTCYVIEPRVYFIDQFGNRRIDLIATEEIETRTLEQIITENSTAEISNTVVKISDVNPHDIFREIKFLRDLRALILCLTYSKSLERSAFISTLQLNFDNVEDKSNKEVLYVRCFNNKRALEKPDSRVLGSDNDTCCRLHDDNH